MTGSPTAYCTQKKNTIFCREKIKDQIFYTQASKKERKKERLTSSDNVRHEEFSQSINASVVALN